MGSVIVESPLLRYGEKRTRKDRHPDMWDMFSIMKVRREEEEEKM